MADRGDHLASARSPGSCARTPSCGWRRTACTPPSPRKGGGAEHPTWYHNFVAHPEVELQDGPEPHTYRARVAEGEERAEWWERAVAQYAPYAEYQEKTDREIPVFLLERV